MTVFTPSAQVVTHSILKPSSGVTPRELVTFVGNFHPFVLSEFNTHRSFSRNSASSRAVPVTQRIELAKLAGVTVVFTCDRRSLQAFFDLRISPHAQPEIREFAIAVKKAFNDSAPNELGVGQIHLPYVEKIYQWDEVFNRQTIAYDVGEKDEFVYSLPIFQSVATCARVSYLFHEKSQTDLNQEKLFWDLHKNRHMSVFEHVAVALSSDDKLSKAIRRDIIGQFAAPRQNYTRDYLQLRKIIEKENLLSVDR